MTMPLIFAATSDLAGKVRGKAFPANQLENRLKSGVGWAPTNVMITCFDGIAEGPFGALGDLLLIPDSDTEVRATFGNGPAEHFMIGDIMTLEGLPWEFCTRSILKNSIKRLHEVAGVHLISAFEHEFQFKSAPMINNQAFGLEGFQMHRRLFEKLMAKLDENNIEPECVMKEYGYNQYELVVRPKEGIRAADEAVILRELTRAAARAFGETATFTPIRDPANVGNGVHIHMSFINDSGEPVTYDEKGPSGMSKITAAFAAGILKHMPTILALTAPSVISYERLTPHRWSASYNNLGFRDREASLRICPVTKKSPASIAKQFNIEYRAADAAASPYLALAALIHAGCEGIENELTTPLTTHEDLSLLSAHALAERGLVRLPNSLVEALDRFESNPLVYRWFGEGFLPVYRAHKEQEIAHLESKDSAKCYAAYEDTY